MTSIFSSNNGMNKFSYKFLVEDESVTITFEIRTDLKEFIENALKHFGDYNIPKLKCGVLGYHLENLYSVLRELGETPLDGKICIIQYSNPGKEPRSYELSSEQERIRIDIDDRIRRELARFPKLNLVEHAFDDYFEQTRKTLRLLVKNALKFSMGMSP